MQDCNIVGIILAAGKGTRMAPFSNRFPKPILPVCNKPHLYYQIEMMKTIGIRRIIIVIGHLGYEICQVFGNGSNLGVMIQYVEQKEPMGIAHAVGQLEPYVDSPMLLALGDIFFVHKDLAGMKKILAEKNAGAVLAVKYEENPEAVKRNFSVLLDDEGLVKRVIEKPRHIINNLKGCGLYLFDQYVFDAIRRTPRTAMRDEYEITDTIQILVDDGLPVFTSEVINWDMNMTYPSDVLACNLYQLKRLGKKNIISDSAIFHQKSKFNNTVIGDNVVIQHPIKITNSVIFPKTRVTSLNDIDRFILTPDHQIDCRHLMQNGGIRLE